MKQTMVLAIAGLVLAVKAFAAVEDSPSAQVFAPPTAKLSPGQAVDARELESFVDGIVKAGMLALNVAGAQVVVVQGGRPVLLKGYGLSNLDPAQPVDPQQTLFRIGSISKVFTWMLVMREVERGRIRLDAPVNDYLPDDLKIPDQGFAEPVRMIHLLSHSAGFESRSTGEFMKDPRKILSLENRLKRQFPARVFEPGLLSSYSDQGAELAGYIVARLNGVDFETLAEQEIFAPLGLAHTTFRQPHPAREDLAAPMPQALASNVSTGFGWSGSDFQARPFEYTPAPSGSVSATGSDMARVMQLLLNGGSLDGVTLYGPATARAFRTPIMKVPDGINGWAHGLIVYDLPGGYRGYGHSGGMLSFLSNMVVIPQLDLGVYVTTNTNTGWGLAERIPSAVVERFYAVPDSQLRRQGSPALVNEADLYEGRYVTTRRAFSGLERFRYLLRSSGAVSITSDGYLLTAGQKWAPETPRGRFRSLDGAHVLQFDFDAQGQARSYQDDSGTGVSQRVGLLLDRNLFFLLAGLTVLFAFAKLGGLMCAAASNGRPTRAHPIRAQGASHILGSAAAALWLISIYGFVTWATADTLTRVYTWPGFRLLIGSAAALLACVASVALLGLLPSILRGSDGWSAWRKSRHVVMVLVFVLFAGMLAAWSALVPWLV